MLKDRYGEVVSTSSAKARDAYVAALDLMLAADAGVDEGLTAALDEDPCFMLAHLARARHRQMRGDAAGIGAPLAAVKAATGLTAREDALRAVMTPLLEGRGGEAYPLIRAHLIAHPRDVVAAQTCAGVFGLIGFSGQPGREAEQLAFTTSLAPHYGDDWWFLSTHAFAEMESGRTGPAAISIERALEINPRNANGAHYRSHLYYETGEAAAGYAYISDWMGGYSRAGLLHTHIAWHVALWAMESGDEGALWRIYDADIAPGAATGPALNVLTDCAALLYRAELAGLAIPEGSWGEVSAYAARMFPAPGLGFADAHAALAHAMAGNGEALARISEGAKGPVADLVRALAGGFGALAASDWAAAAAHLTGAMTDHARLGGSRAQRDLIEFAMAAALLRLGRGEEARRLLAIRRPVAAMPAAVKGLAAAT